MVEVVAAVAEVVAVARRIWPRRCCHWKRYCKRCWRQTDGVLAADRTEEDAHIRCVFKEKQWGERYR